MPVLLIAYDLHKKPKEEYDEFHKIVKSYSYTTLSESSYAINTTDTIKIVYDKLCPIVDDGDKFYIIALTNPHLGHGLTVTLEWLDKNLPSQDLWKS